MACKNWRNIEMGVKYRRVDSIWHGHYPTVKNRLNRIAGQLQFIEIVKVYPAEEEVIDELERGEISAEEAIRRLTL